jgi:hypothetical protein
VIAKSVPVSGCLFKIDPNSWDNSFKTGTIRGYSGVKTRVTEGETNHESAQRPASS